MSGGIQAEGVDFGYNKNQVLQNFNVTIHPGEKVAIVGQSGIGKSTFFKLLLRCYDCQKGQIFLDSSNIKDLSLSVLRDNVGIVFQESFLFADTVWENLRFGNPQATDEQILDAAMIAHAHEFIMELPQGYDTVLESRGDNLSGGQKQRLSIVRIILKNPQVYLLDEITSDLDNITEDVLLDGLLEYAQDKTILTVSHRLSVIRKFPRILVLHNGRIVEDGNFNELYQKGTFFSQILQKGMHGDD